jgi:hypothetical protein
MKRSAITLAGLAGLGALAFAPAAAHADARAILDAVNTEREAAGLDPLSTRADLNSACSSHARYMHQAGFLTNTEDSTSSLFSTQGLWAAGHSVLAQANGGFYTNPWKSAPLHEFQLLHPWLLETGVGVSGNFACMVAGGERNAPNPDDYGIKIVPAAGQYAPAAEIARETPYPGDDVGIPEGTKTGPYLYAYLVGPERMEHVTVTNATLTSFDDGSKVPVRWVDSTSPKSGPFLDGGAMVIPTEPLAEGSGYSLLVEATTTTSSGAHLRISRTSGFTTGPDETGEFEAPTTNDTVSASRTGGPSKKVHSPIILGAVGQPKLTVSLVWSNVGVRARIHCASQGERCTGPLRILVKKKNGHYGKLRFMARKGPLKINLAANHTITRRVAMDTKQRRSGKKRGFAIRWGGPEPVPAKAYKK